MSEPSETLTEDEAAELRALLNSPPGSPGKPIFETKGIPLGDASMLADESCEPMVVLNAEQSARFREPLK